MLEEPESEEAALVQSASSPTRNQLSFEDEATVFAHPAECCPQQALWGTKRYQRLWVAEAMEVKGGLQNTAKDRQN